MRPSYARYGLLFVLAVNLLAVSRARIKGTSPFDPGHSLSSLKEKPELLRKLRVGNPKPEEEVNTNKTKGSKGTKRKEAKGTKTEVSKTGRGDEVKKKAHRNPKPTKTTDAVKQDRHDTEDPMEDEWSDEGDVKESRPGHDDKREKDQDEDKSPDNDSDKLPKEGKRQKGKHDDKPRGKREEEQAGNDDEDEGKPGKKEKEGHTVKPGMDEKEPGKKERNEGKSEKGSNTEKHPVKKEKEEGLSSKTHKKPRKKDPEPEGTGEETVADDEESAGRNADNENTLIPTAPIVEEPAEEAPDLPVMPESETTDETTSETLYEEVPQKKLVERQISVLAFEYNTTSKQLPGEIDYVELSRVTDHLLSSMYQWYLDGIKVVKFEKLHLERYTVIAPRLVQFEVQLFFHEREGIVVPSQGQIDAVVEHGFAENSDFYVLYINRLQNIPFGVFSSTTAFRCITSPEDLLSAVEEHKSSNPSSGGAQDVEENEVLVPLAAAAAVAALLICVAIWSYCRGRLRSKQVTNNACMKQYRDDTNDDSSTGVSDFRTSVFSDQQSNIPEGLHGDRAVNEDQALQDELDAIMNSLEEISLDDENQEGNVDVAVTIGNQPQELFDPSIPADDDSIRELVQNDANEDEFEIIFESSGPDGDSTEIITTRSTQTDTDEMRESGSAQSDTDEMRESGSAQSDTDETRESGSVQKESGMPVWAVRSFQKPTDETVPITSPFTKPEENTRDMDASKEEDSPFLMSTNSEPTLNEIGPSGPLSSSEKNGYTDGVTADGSIPNSGNAMAEESTRKGKKPEWMLKSLRPVTKVTTPELATDSQPTTEKDGAANGIEQEEKKPEWMTKNLRRVGRPKASVEQQESSGIQAQEESLEGKQPVWASKSLRRVESGKELERQPASLVSDKSEDSVPTQTASETQSKAFNEGGKEPAYWSSRSLKRVDTPKMTNGQAGEQKPTWTAQALRSVGQTKENDKKEAGSSSTTSEPASLSDGENAGKKGIFWNPKQLRPVASRDEKKKSEDKDLDSKKPSLVPKTGDEEVLSRSAAGAPAWASKKLRSTDKGLRTTCTVGTVGLVKQHGSVGKAEHTDDVATCDDKKSILPKFKCKADNPTSLSEGDQPKTTPPDNSSGSERKKESTNPGLLSRNTPVSTQTTTGGGHVAPPQRNTTPPELFSKDASKPIYSTENPESSTIPVGQHDNDDEGSLASTSVATSTETVATNATAGAGAEPSTPTPLWMQKFKQMEQKESAD